MYKINSILHNFVANQIDKKVLEILRDIFYDLSSHQNNK
jgi:hypothetical protein